MYICIYIYVYVRLCIYDIYYIYYIYTYIYIIYIIYTVNMGLSVSEKFVFPTRFGRGRFEGNLFSFEKHKWLQKILFDAIFLEILHNGVASFLTGVDENYIN